MGSIGLSRVCHPSTLRILISPEASKAQSSIGTVSAHGSTGWVLILRRNSSFNRLMALVVRAAFHCAGSSLVKVNSRSPASSKLSATARCFSRHLLRPRCWHRSCRDSRCPAPHACASGHAPEGCDACERCSAGSAGRRPRAPLIENEKLSTEICRLLADCTRLGSSSSRMWNDVSADGLQWVSTS